MCIFFNLDQSKILSSGNGIKEPLLLATKISIFLKDTYWGGGGGGGRGVCLEYLRIG